MARAATPRSLARVDPLTHSLDGALSRAIQSRAVARAVALKGNLPAIARQMVGRIGTLRRSPRHGGRKGARARIFAIFMTLVAVLPAHVRPIVTFLYWTGWRRGEALSRQWHHVDTDIGIIRLEPGETKNRRGRDFPYSVIPELAAVIEQRRAYTDEVQRRTGQVVPWLFHREGRPIKTFTTAWRRRADVPASSASRMTSGARRCGTSCGQA